MRLKTMNYLESNRDIYIKIMDKFEIYSFVKKVMFFGEVAREYIADDSDIDIAIFSKVVLNNISLREKFI